MQVSAVKAELRRLCLLRRKAVPLDAARDFAARLASEVPTVLAGAARDGTIPVISAYWPIRDEADTRPLLAALAELGVTTALPVTGGRGHPLVFRAWKPGDAQNPGQMAIPEPLSTAAQVEPDVLFVPLAAFDRRGHRIGYGAGHYDCTLAQLRAKKPVVAIGIAFATQEIAEVPSEPHDQKLDFVLTERELIDCRNI